VLGGEVGCFRCSSLQRRGGKPCSLGCGFATRGLSLFWLSFLLGGHQVSRCYQDGLTRSASVVYVTRCGFDFITVRLEGLHPLRLERCVEYIHQGFVRQKAFHRSLVIDVSHPECDTFEPNRRGAF
jgi:hypothetical protein